MDHKMSIKTRPRKTSVKSFIDRVKDDKRKKDCRVVMKILKDVTGKSPQLWGSSIVGYGTYYYTNTTKVENKWPLVGLSPRKNDLTVYIMPGFERYSELMSRLGKYKTGKSCLYINDLADIDMDVLKLLISASFEKMTAGSDSGE